MSKYRVVELANETFEIQIETEESGSKTWGAAIGTRFNTVEGAFRIMDDLERRNVARRKATAEDIARGIIGVYS